jgi:hypothetical protein
MEETMGLLPARDASALGSAEAERSPRLSCMVCQHEIPLSAAASAEATDYVAYFCGLECYEQWRNRSGAP